MMPFYQMIQNLITRCQGVYYTRESYGKPYIVGKKDNQILISAVENNKIRWSIPFRPTDEDYFATDWEEFRFLSE